MTSKVTAKLPLGVAFSMLLISLTLFVGCKQEADNSYTPPGYGTTVGYLTDTTWKSGNETIKFGAEGSVSVPDSMKKIDTEFGVVEFGDFTYSVSGTPVTISAKVKKAPADLSGWISAGDIIDVATCTIGTTASSGTQGSSTSTSGTYKYYQMKVSKFGEEQTFTMENIPNSGNKFVGTYYNARGVKSVQINKDGTFVSFDEGGKSIRNWTFNENGTISVTLIGSDSTSSSTIYYLYPHALMYNGSVSSYK